MRPRPPSLSMSVASWCVPVLLLPALILASLMASPQAAAHRSSNEAANIANGGSFFSAVPALNASDTFAVSTYADTITDPDPGLPALTSIGGSTSTLASLAQAGALFGMAYDDGSYSGAERIILGSYTKRHVQFGPSGVDGLYQYIINYPANPSLNGQLHFFTHPTWGNQPDAGPSTIHSGGDDSHALNWVSKSGYGDLEISPDGRTLYAMNLYSKRIETWNLRTAAHTGAISVDLSAIPAHSYDDANNLIPFALQFYPVAQPLTVDGPPVPLLAIGVTDTAEGNSDYHGHGDQPDAYVIIYAPSTGQWLGLSNHQPLQSVARNVQAGGFFPDDGEPWYPWRRDLNGTIRMGSRVTHPMPLLTNIEYSRDGQHLILGVRDIVGDLTYFNGNYGQRDSVVQGDTIRYHLNGAGTAWLLDGGEIYHDDWDLGGGGDHVENHMGGLATSLTSVSAGMSAYAGYTENLQTTALFGATQSGVYRYSEAGGNPAYMSTVNHAPFNVPGSKAGLLGDVEYLASFAIIGGRVWNDTNNSGTYATGEPTLANVTVQYLDEHGTVHGGATTGANGVYVMAVPPNTDFTLRINPGEFAGGQTLAGYRMARQDVGDGGNPHHDPSTDSDASQLTRRIDFGTSRIPTRLRDSDTRSYSFGVIQVQGVGRVEGVVWNDIDTDSRLDSEPRWPNVRVYLERDDTRSGGPALRSYSNLSQTTISDGSYFFDRVEPGYYRVRFAPMANAMDSARIRDNHANAASGWASDWFIVDEAANRSQVRNAAMRLGTDVSISKHGPHDVLIADEYVYTLSYRNSGGQADSVWVQDDLPSGVSYVSATPAPTSRSGQQLRWNLGTLANGATGNITVRVRPLNTAPAAVTNSAAISTSTTDTNTSNNTSTWATNIRRPALSVVKSGPATATVGEGYGYLIRVRNTGDGEARDVVLTDVVPPELRISTTNPAANQSGNTLTWNLGTVPPGYNQLFSVVVASDIATIPFDPVAKNAVLTNNARVTTSTHDDPGDNASSHSTTIQVPDMHIDLSTTSSAYAVGRNVTVQARIGNAGTAWGRHAHVEITVPDGITFDSARGGSGLYDSCAYNAGTRVVSCDVAHTAGGDFWTSSNYVYARFTIPGDLDVSINELAFSGSITNDVPEHPSTLADNRDSHRIDVLRPNPYIEVTAPTSAVDGNTIGQGSYFAYTITYGNDLANLGRPSHLTADADDVEVQINLSSDVTFHNVDTGNQSRCSESGGTVTCAIGHLAPRVNNQQILVIVQTNAPAGTDLPVEAIISTTSAGDDISDNRDSASTTVVPPPDEVPDGTSDLTLAIHGDLDPRSQDGDPGNAVYWIEGIAFSWPLGEVLDFTPRLNGLSLQSVPSPYEYRAEVLGWSVVDFTLPDGTVVPATGADSRSETGCRGSGAMAQHNLTGCLYTYLGGDNLTQIQGSAPAPTELEMHEQARAYWTHPPAPSGMTTDAYVFTMPEIGPVQLTVEVAVEIRLVTPTAPTTIGGVPIPGMDFPIPPPRIQVFQGTFDLTPVAPRTMIGPGSVVPGDPVQPM